MRILQINASYKPAYIYGGPTMSVSRLSEELSKAACRVEVFSTNANGSGELQVETGRPQSVDGVAVTYFRRISGDHTHLSPGLLWRLWKNARQFDVIHIHAWWNLVSVLACWLAVGRGVPVVVSPRGTLSPYSHDTGKPAIKKLMQRLLGYKLLQQCSVHVTSGREEAAVRAAIRFRHLFNIPNFVKTGPDGASSAAGGSELRLLFLSRIEQKKGLDILLRALPRLDIPFRLTVAGDGHPDYIRTLKQQAKAAGMEGYINWIGFQGSGKFELISSHHLLVLPSYDENFGNVVIESLSVGTAVLISRNVGLADYVTANRLGWVGAETEDELASHIRMIDGNREELERIRIDAPPRIREDFNPDTLVRQYLHMYREIIANG